LAVLPISPTPRSPNVPAAHAQCQQTIKRIAIVALARKLIVALWRFLHRPWPAGAVLKAAKA